MSVKFLRKYHKWIAIIITLFLLCFSISGIILNHRELFSSFDVSRQYLPQDYQYKNYNLAAIKNIEFLSPDSCIAYGNIGLWLTNRNLTEFQDFSKGFPDGIDHKKSLRYIKQSKGSCFLLQLLAYINMIINRLNGNIFL